MIKYLSVSEPPYKMYPVSWHLTNWNQQVLCSLIARDLFTVPFVSVDMVLVVLEYPDAGTECNLN